MNDTGHPGKEDRQTIPQMQSPEQRIDRISELDECGESAENRVDPDLLSCEIKDGVAGLESAGVKDEGGGDGGDKGLESDEVKDDGEDRNSVELQLTEEKGCDEVKVYGVEVSIDNSAKETENQVDPVLQDDAMDVDQVDQQMNMFEVKNEVENTIDSKSQSSGDKDDPKERKLPSPNATTEEAEQIVDSQSQALEAKDNVQSGEAKENADHLVDPKLEPNDAKDETQKIEPEASLPEVKDDSQLLIQMHSGEAKDDIVTDVDVIMQSSPVVKDSGDDLVDMHLEPPEVTDDVEQQIDQQMQSSEATNDAELFVDAQFKSHEAGGHIQFETDIEMQSPKAREDAENLNVPSFSEVMDSVEHLIDIELQTLEDAEHQIDPTLKSDEAKGEGEHPIDLQKQSSQVNEEQQQSDLPPQSLISSMPTADDMLAVLTEMEAAFAVCLPQEELKNLDLYSGPSQQVNALPEPKDNIPAEEVEKNMGLFMSAANKLHKYFIGMQQPDPPSRADVLRKEIAVMEDELKIKDELINKHQKKLKGWRKDVEEQLGKHRDESRRV